MSRIPPAELSKRLARGTVKGAAYALLALPFALAWSWFTRDAFVVHYVSLLVALLIAGVMQRYLRAPASR